MKDSKVPANNCQVCYIINIFYKNNYAKTLTKQSSFVLTALEDGEESVVGAAVVWAGLWLGCDGCGSGATSVVAWGDGCGSGATSVVAWGDGYGLGAMGRLDVIAVV